MAKAVSMADAVSMLRVSRYAVRMADAVSRWRTEGQSSILAVSLFAFWPSSPPKYFAVSDNILVKFAFANQ